MNPISRQYEVLRTRRETTRAIRQQIPLTKATADEEDEEEEEEKEEEQEEERRGEGISSRLEEMRRR